MTNKRFHNLFGRPPRKPESPITQEDMDLAASIQAVTEEAMLRMANHVYGQTKEENLCLAGGVALNYVGNGRILRRGKFKKIWIQPAAGDAGAALGAALFAWYQYLGNKRNVSGQDSQRGSYLGPEFSSSDIEGYLKENRISYIKLDSQEIPEKIADLINAQKVIGWFQGRMEFGPRALGARSILGDARSSKMQEIINLKIKFRESFRPFAPSVLATDAHEYFDLECPSPYMLLVAPVVAAARCDQGDEEKLFGLARLHNVHSKIPAVTHVDYSARIQTVDGDYNALYYKMLAKFKEKYGCSVVVNTSFNVRGEPIVCTPRDAFLCFMRTNMDYLIMGNYLLEKKEQKPLDKDIDWLKKLELD